MSDAYQTKISIINITFSAYLRRRILELDGGIPPTAELYSTLSRMFTEKFPDRMSVRLETALNIFAHTITIHLLEYESFENDVILFIEYAEKYVKSELKQAHRWSPVLAQE
jgi:hypothetical protein